MPKAPPEWIIITGLSGSGKSLASRCFEDMGFFCIDNLPLALLPAFKTLASQAASIERVALVMDIRETGFIKNFPKTYQENLRAGGIRGTLIFLESSDLVLRRRFSESRRPHPLKVGLNDSLKASIARERKALAPVRAMADVVIDTSTLSIPRLKKTLLRKFQKEIQPERMRVTLTSFGFKYGVPTDASVVFDLRFLHNPQYRPQLRLLTGLDPRVRRYVARSGEYKEFIRRVLELLGFLIPNYQKEGKAYLNIALGCTGGKHRSVTAVEAVSRGLKKMDFQPVVEHRDIELK